MDGQFEIDLIGSPAHAASAALRGCGAKCWQSRRYFSVTEYCGSARCPARDGVVVVLSAARAEAAERKELSGLADWLRARSVLVPLILVGARGEAVRGWETGAARFIVWPSEPGAARAAIRATLAHFQQLRHLATPLAECGAHLARLSRREREVLERLADGWWIKRIALHFGTSPCTVRNQRRGILEKLEVRSELEAVLLIQTARWLEAVRKLHG